MSAGIEVVSSFFADNSSVNVKNNKLQKRQQISEEFLNIIDELNLNLAEVTIPPSIHCVYNPTIYARNTFELYVTRYCCHKKPIMYFGMNPGPWGMSQTGVPFGEVNSVRDWLSIEGPVGKPDSEIQARPVKGFDCTRCEVSGKRFWGLWKNLCGEPVNFFNTSFVYNYLPQQWMKANGCNLTPGDFKTSEMQELYSVCDNAFIKVLKLYEVQIIVAVGKFCEGRAQRAIKKYMPHCKIKIYNMPHPSPRAVMNNSCDWQTKAMQCLKEHDLIKYYQKGNVGVS